jgi:pimeloyl-ACP methyl ester carboxylesterase
MGRFQFDEHWIEYDSFGEGERTLVLIHGLLMNQTMFGRLAPAMAAAGNRVVTIDLLGHGRSDQPGNPFPYSNTQFARQILALLDHLGAEQAVVGGTSLGANVALETAHLAPDRVRGLFVEMPVLDHALLFAASVFTPLALGLHFGKPVVRLMGKLTRQIPRSFFLLDIVLDWLRREPEPSEGVLLGLLQGRVVPHRDDRVALTMPALVIGHPSDPLHPFSDAEMLVNELPDGRLVDANSFLEWRIRPERLNAELAGFLDEVWTTESLGGVRRGRTASRARRAKPA